MPAEVRYAMAAEDYVKVIYAHTEWQPEPITTSVLAARLGLAASSVTEMVKKLGAQGLVDHVPYGAVRLTPDGTALALRMVRRHRLIETWLVGQFGYGWHEVHDEAEVLEHALSDRLLESIDEQLGFPVRDPHGDPIPRRDGRVEQPRAVLLRDVAAGETVRIVRISDRDPMLLRRVESDSIILDREFTVVSTEPLVVRPGDGSGDVALAEDCLDAIWVGR
jgi:DtxR family Mn-dependent transcriptional regulator